MGRIKTQLTKRITFKLIELHRDEFKKDYESNKQLVSKFADIHGKKLRNVIAGYVTRLMKKGEE
ncbi:30S ribosomal protein S17e [Candidatus Woesearchaeota archaeon]|nr:30S ribosomal protein S17e [Candidatus Woesearchaeota archaeon]